MLAHQDGYVEPEFEEICPFSGYRPAVADWKPSANVNAEALTRVSVGIGISGCTINTPSPLALR
jgi:hypothetical protein